MMRVVARGAVYAAALFLYVTPAAAAPLTVYDVFGHTTATPLPATFVAPNVASSDFTFSGVTQIPDPFATGGFAATGWPSGALGASFSEVTITPDAGFEIAFDLVSGNFGGFSNATWELRWSGDGFTAPLASFSHSAGFVVLFDAPLALPAQTGPVTFRFYAFITGGDPNGALGSFDLVGNRPIHFDGTVTRLPVPEPSLLILLGTAIVGAAARRRRG